MTLTPRFPPHIKPVHVGVYRTWPSGSPFETTYQHWNGKRWGCLEHSARGANLIAFREFKSLYQRVSWAGLTTPEGR